LNSCQADQSPAEIADRDAREVLIEILSDHKINNGWVYRFIQAMLT
jgi:hypothetical protein